MSLVSSVFDSMGSLAKMPAEVVKGLASHYIALIFFGGFIFFIANTPPEHFQNVFSAFADGDIAGTLGAIVDASIAFADNVKENFNPEALSATVQDALCKVMDYSGAKDCK